MAIAMAIRVSLLSLLVISSANLTFALYEDQVDLMDWYQQHISKVLQAVFQTQKAVWKRVVVAAEENAIASLDLRHGDISGSILRAGNFPEGLLVWESFHQISQPSKLLLYIPPSLKVDEDHVMMFRRNFLSDVVSLSSSGSILRVWNFP